MEGYQFARIETYSIQGAPKTKGGQTKYRRNGQRAWTAEEVLDEAERKRLASLHVEPGGPPPQILPGTVSCFDDLRDKYHSVVSRKETYMRKQKDGTHRKAKRKLRTDARTLYSSVVSLPTLSADALADPELKKTCVDLLEAAMAHERRLVMAGGGELLMGVIHWDEDHVHAHYLAICPEGQRVDVIHPGMAPRPHSMPRTPPRRRVAPRGSTGRRARPRRSARALIVPIATP